MKCPVCSITIPESRISQGLIYCTCGWEPSRTQSARSHKSVFDRILVFAFALGVLATAGCAVFYFTWQPFAWQTAPLLIKQKLKIADEQDLHELGAICNTKRKTQCSIEVYQTLIRLAPSDMGAVANLGVLYAQNNEFEKSIQLFEIYFRNGEGASDAYYWYSKALTGLGKKEESITATYQTLAIEPRLLDAMNLQIQNLTSVGRPEEALSLIHGSMRLFPAMEQYFKGNLVTLNDLIQKKSVTAQKTKDGFRLPAVGSHFFVPIRFGSRSYQPFLYDTGASILILSTKLAYECDLQKFHNGKTAKASLADGSQVVLKLITIPSLWVGASEIHNVEAAYCDQCTLLMGQSLNSRFDSVSTKVNGTDFLTLKAL